MQFQDPFALLSRASTFLFSDWKAVLCAYELCLNFKINTHYNNRESKISATGTNDWTKSLNSSMYSGLFPSKVIYWLYISSGNAFLNPAENIQVVDNLVDGFDLYRYPHTAPFHTIELSRKTSYTHGAAFIENGMQIACGSDHGIVYLYSVEKAERTQTLKHGSRRTMIQALDVSCAQIW